ncbi:MAG: molybdopterin molybdenumtransferase MoeA, partial [Cyanobacteriota bacterium]|nr:molybdopterin molybdenumtransferase MoeA [Cyanobacteriota bacterium]
MAEPFPPEGLPLPEARGRVLEAIHPLPGQETLPLAACLGRVSAEDCRASEAVPGFRASIMDGYATADGVPPPPESCWRLVGRSAPGAPFPGTL